MMEGGRLSLAAVVFGITFISMADPALAAPIPGPVIGASLPALALFAGGYWLTRRVTRIRNRSSDTHSKEQQDDQA